MPWDSTPAAVSAYVTHSTGWLGDVTFPSGAVKQHETGDVEWIIEYNGTTYGDWLGDWVSAASNRVELRHNTAEKRLLIAAPTGAVVPTSTFDLGVLGGGDTLAERSGIDLVAPNRVLTNTTPLTESDLISPGAWESPGTDIENTIIGALPSSGARFNGEAGPYDLQTAVTRTRADETGESGGGVTVGIVDTGLNYNQDLYGDRVTAAKNTISGEEIDPAAGDYAAVVDGNGHGSWCATAAAGNGDATNGTGAAVSATLVPVKALADDGSGATTDIVEGIEYCAAQGCDVINLSLGAPVTSDPVVNAVEKALENGVTAVVTAAGNARMTTHYMGSPASADPTIPVASIDSEPAAESLSAYYSSTGPNPQTGESMGVAAGGHRVTATVADTDGTLNENTLSGTSMAAPIVSGVVAQMLAADSSLIGAAETVRERLRAAAEPLPKCGVTEVGAGRVDAVRAVNGTASESTQKAARASEAQTRDALNKNLIETNWLTGWL
ncbi:peptidase S8 and S53 subtilisin kexin sedolisin [Natrinema thermotolerans DSM 11552]|nr:peptidase S8 and S53 subtilisin kexin sedolisin [Natrinema thermotolerans DSM 11552]